ncbi:MAG: hypothetical protein H6618_05380 [Deltaproteobacteria bacterium]|nr:hypothetical protein [Deltaproteobacteria bacterium]
MMACSPSIKKLRKEQLMVTRVEPGILWFFVLLSLCIHLSLFYVLQTDKAQHSPSVVELPSVIQLKTMVSAKQIPERQKSKIEISPESLASHQSKTISTSPEKRDVAEAAPNPESAEQSGQKALPGLLSYPDLSGDFSSLALGSLEDTGSGERQPYHGSASGALNAAGHTLSVHLDIPLVFRREATQGRAYAILRRLSAEEIMIEVLAGTADIRAVLYEGFHQVKAFNKLLSLFGAFDSEFIKISLEYVNTLPSSEDIRDDFKTEYHMFRNEIQILLVRVPGFPANSSGIIPEDEHAERAKRWDRAQLSRLRKSVAFRRAIRNHKLTKSP